MSLSFLRRTCILQQYRMNEHLCKYGRYLCTEKARVRIMYQELGPIVPRPILATILVPYLEPHSRASTTSPRHHVVKPLVMQVPLQQPQQDGHPMVRQIPVRLGDLRAFCVALISTRHERRLQTTPEQTVRRLAGLGKVQMLHEMLCCFNWQQNRHVLRTVTRWALQCRQWSLVTSYLEQHQFRNDHRLWIQVGQVCPHHILVHLLRQMPVDVPLPAVVLYGLSSCGRVHTVEWYLEHAHCSNWSLPIRMIQGEETSLHAACRYGHLDCMNLLLSVVDVRVGQISPLTVAAEHGHLQICRRILTSVDSSEWDRPLGRCMDTPLGRATHACRMDIVQLLLQYPETSHDAVIQECTRSMYTTLLQSSSLASVCVFEILLLLYGAGGRVGDDKICQQLQGWYDQYLESIDLDH